LSKDKEEEDKEVEGIFNSPQWSPNKIQLQTLHCPSCLVSFKV
jgi:hypothetical protein